MQACSGSIETKEIGDYGYESDPNLKGPKHGPYETILDKTTGKEKTVCLCTMCGKKNIVFILFFSFIYSYFSNGVWY